MLHPEQLICFILNGRAVAFPQPLNTVYPCLSSFRGRQPWDSYCDLVKASFAEACWFPSTDI